MHDRDELLAAYDRTAPYCMTLQEFIDFDQYVRCFTFGKTDIVPVHYDPRERRYIVDHAYLSSELGERVVKDAQTINQALGYEMNTIEFAVQDGVPYAIDFLNPAPDFERDRITSHYFDMAVDRMAKLVIDRAMSGDLDQPVAALGADGGSGGGGWRHWAASLNDVTNDDCRIDDPLATGRQQPGARERIECRTVTDAIEHWHALLRPDVELTPISRRGSPTISGGAAVLRRSDSLPVPPAVLPRRGDQVALVRAGQRDDRADGRDASRTRRSSGRGLLDAVALTEAERALVAIEPGYATREHGLPPRLVHPSRLAAVRRVQRRVACGPRLHREAVRLIRAARGPGAVSRAVRRVGVFR